MKFDTIACLKCGYVFYDQRSGTGRAVSSVNFRQHIEGNKTCCALRGVAPGTPCPEFLRWSIGNCKGPAPMYPPPQRVIQAAHAARRAAEGGGGGGGGGGNGGGGGGGGGSGGGGGGGGGEINNWARAPPPQTQVLLSFGRLRVSFGVIVRHC